MLSPACSRRPSDFVRDAQWVKVKEDCEAIGSRRAHDARRALLQARRHGACGRQRVDLLWSGNHRRPINPTSSASTSYPRQE
jgi:hypothetical protein